LLFLVGRMVLGFIVIEKSQSFSHFRWKTEKKKDT
jgi:hypothetical protein